MMNVNILNLLTADVPNDQRSATLNYALKNMDPQVAYYLHEFQNIQTLDDCVVLLKKMISRKITSPQEHKYHNVFIGLLREASYVYPSHFLDRFIFCLENDKDDVFQLFPSERCHDIVTHNVLSYLLNIETDVPFDDRLLGVSLHYITLHFIQDYDYFSFERMKINYKRYVQEYLKHVLFNQHDSSLLNTIPLLKEIYEEDTWYMCLYEKNTLSMIKQYAPVLLSNEMLMLAELYPDLTWKECANGQKINDVSETHIILG